MKRGENYICLLLRKFVNLKFRNLNCSLLREVSALCVTSCVSLPKQLSSTYCCVSAAAAVKQTSQTLDPQMTQIHSDPEPPDSCEHRKIHVSKWVTLAKLQYILYLILCSSNYILFSDSLYLFVYSS